MKSFQATVKHPSLGWMTWTVFARNVGEAIRELSDALDVDPKWVHSCRRI